ncbi:MAG TPA: hypothetical protein VGL76_03755 [Gaiellaceae bacterium]
MLALILAGCGGSGNTSWQQVHGVGFSFEVPAGWELRGTAASNGTIDRVEVQSFKLEHPYTRAKRDAVARELDGDAGNLAQQLKGTLSSKTALRVGGLDARAYTIGYDSKVAQITFVLSGEHEYELFCRRSAGGSDSACAQLVASFRAASAKP